MPRPSLFSSALSRSIPNSPWRTPIWGLSYSAVGESVLSAQNTTRAWQLRDRVSDRERFFIDFTYDRQVTGNLEKAYQTLELWLQTYPRGNGTTQALRICWGAFPRTGPADLKERSRPPKKQSRLIPTSLFAYGSLASDYFFLDRFEEAESVLQRATERKLEDPILLMIRYNIAVLKGDQDQMDRIVALAKGKPGAEHRWRTRRLSLWLVPAG